MTWIFVFWKSNADDPIKLLNKREEEAINYRKRLIEKYKYVPNIKRIRKTRRLPKYILNKKKVLQIKKQTKFKKLKNREMNSKPGDIKYIPERKDKITNTEIIED